ncbi:hypothetical protein Salat_0686400 [Sesamum alatum]|uniref:Uncharacterized protein n=1 Tax=Sesamum alatum TaxID=300844 RepID=A0AAE2CUM4_9LAMI|nr:hypothetical protein Salat_0686400 [Sesamum alatum]
MAFCTKCVIIGHIGSKCSLRQNNPKKQDIAPHQNSNTKEITRWSVVSDRRRNQNPKSKNPSNHNPKNLTKWIPKKPVSKPNSKFPSSIPVQNIFTSLAQQLEIPVQAEEEPG